MSKKIFIFDTTLRDGEQSPGISLNMNEKLKIAKQLSELGVDVIEAGFPVASNGDFEGVRAIAKNVKNSVIAALARTSKLDIDRAWEAIKYAEQPRIHTFIATSDIHMRYKLKMEPEEVLGKAVEMVEYARRLCPEVEFSPEDATRTDPEFLYRVIESVINAGASVVNIPDTVGYITPGEMGELIRNIRNKVSNIDKAVISVHCHNDLGMAVANSLSAIENGAGQVECTVNGLGERAGNAALEEIVMALKTRKDFYSAATRLTTERLYRTSSMVSFATGISVQPNKAIVGANAFAHESGIHQHGVLSKRETYEIMTPESVGLRKSQIILGKHSGRHAFEEKLKEMGYSGLEQESIQKAFQKFKDLADKKKYIMDRDIEALVTQESGKATETYTLEHFQITSGSGITSTSTVKIRYRDNIFEEAACGEGPVDATFNAIDRVVGMKAELEDYFIKAATEGKDALGEVTVKIAKDNMKFVGHGISTDVIEASAKAYIDALNNMVFKLDELNKKEIEACKLAKNYNFFGEGVEESWEFEPLQKDFHI
ncbi:MAG: 2-isopropylmalate synthase [Caulobacteraceae bacterium]